MLRRLVVVGVLAALLASIAVGVRALRGGPGEADAAEAAPTSDPTVAPPSAAPEPPPTTTPPSGPPGTRVPSRDDPARVLLVGDSEAQGLEPFLQRALAGDGLTSLTTVGRNSTGLVRSDYFDWPAHLREIVPELAPDIVVTFIGGNDGQPFIDRQADAVGSPAWREGYAARVGDVMDLLRADGRLVIWIGVPMPGDPGLHERLSAQNEVVTIEARARDDVVLVDTWTLTSGIDGGYAPLVLDPLTGTYRAVRADRDQFHLNSAGAEMVAAQVAHAISDELARRGAANAGASVPTTVDPLGTGRYEVVANDSLSAIAAKTGTTVSAIVAVNGWADQNHVIMPGQEILLPPKAR